MATVPQYGNYIEPAKVMHLGSYNAIHGVQKRYDVYHDYKKWRASEGYKLWLKKQWQKQDGCCYYCKESLKGKQHNVEHVLAISKYGTNSAKNLVLSCQPCNKAKGSKRVKRQVIKDARIFNMQK